MRASDLADILLRRQRGVFLTVLVLAFAAAATVTFLLPKEYEATSTLSVGDKADPSAVGLNDVLAHDYVKLLETAAVVDEVRRELPFRTSSGELESSVSFELSTGTQLVTITGRAPAPERAKIIADVYAATFVKQRRLDELRRKIRAEEAQLARLTKRRRPDRVEIANVRSELAFDRREFDRVRERGTDQAGNVALASRARLPSSPARPKPRLYLLFGALLALGLAVAAALGRHAFDRRIFDEGQLTELFGVPVLARVPNFKPGEEETNRGLRDALHFLRTNLSPSGNGNRGDGGGCVTVITSPYPDAGKTLITSRLSAVLASGAARTLAVDFDLRRPMLATAFRVEATPGVAELLANPRDTSTCIRTTASGLAVLPAGDPPADPAPLVDSPNLPKLLSDLRSRADEVVIDTAPVLAAPESSLVAGRADAVVLVIDMRSPRREGLIAARDQLVRAGASLTGLVLNRVSSSTGYYGGYYLPSEDTSKRAARLLGSRGE